MRYRSFRVLPLVRRLVRRSARPFYFYGDIDGEIVLNDELSEYCWFALDDPALFDLTFAFNQADVVRDFIAFWKNHSD